MQADLCTVDRAGGSCVERRAQSQCAVRSTQHQALCTQHEEARCSRRGCSVLGCTQNVRLWPQTRHILNQGLCLKCRTCRSRHAACTPEIGQFLTFPILEISKKRTIKIQAQTQFCRSEAEVEPSHGVRCCALRTSSNSSSNSN